MKNVARSVLVIAICSAVSAAGLCLAQGKMPITLTPDQLKWAPNAAAPEVKTATVWGDPEKGAHGAFHKFPAGFSAPLHTHSGNGKIVVVSGTMAMAGEDGKEMKFPAGSFYTQPNTFKHTTKCLAGADCVAYYESDAKWDLKPVAK